MLLIYRYDFVFTAKTWLDFFFWFKAMDIVNICKTCSEGRKFLYNLRKNSSVQAMQFSALEFLHPLN